MKGLRKDQLSVLHVPTILSYQSHGVAATRGGQGPDPSQVMVESPSGKTQQSQLYLLQLSASVFSRNNIHLKIKQAQAHSSYIIWIDKEALVVQCVRDNK